MRRSAWSPRHRFLTLALLGLLLVPWNARPADEAAASKASGTEPAAATPVAGRKQKERVMTPGGEWLQGDMSRPRPPVITPGTASDQDKPGSPPSDAIVLFDGADLSQWQLAARGQRQAAGDAPKWKVENGCMEVVPRSGSIVTKEKFGDCQIHIEWAAPAEVKGSGQGRGNSGVVLAGHCEVQVLDSYDNDTYPDGQAAAVYHRYPPLVNASRKPGEWQTYDIVLRQPRLDEDEKIVEAARITIFHNGVLVHCGAEVPGTATECPIVLQDHLNPVRYRNIWVRKLKGYAEP